MTFAVHHPASVAEAVALATRFGDSSRYLAGGTDLVIQINRKRLAPENLINLAPLAELAGIEETADSFSLGALTTHKTIERHPAFQAELVALTEAARVVGGHQVRNVGTVGGNIVNASPAADVVPPLLSLDAEVTLRGAEGERSLPLEKFLLGPGRTDRRPDEILTQIRFAKLPPGSATAFIKAGRRKAMEISVVCVSVRLTRAENRWSAVRIALGAVGATALRVRSAEQLLEGKLPDAQFFAVAGALAAEMSTPITDVRASARYRRLMVDELVQRALTQAQARIG